MTKQQFLDKARSIHGYKYKYIDLPDKITQNDIIKLEMNGISYIQRVGKHLLGKCPEKNTPKKTTQEFIKESKKIWGEYRFDYTNTVYNGALRKVKLFDKIKNIEIEQPALTHLHGSEMKNLKSDQFIEMSKLVSDYKYKYDKCEYINKTTKVTLICPVHGEFNILPFNHLNYGEVCKQCEITLIFKDIKKFLNKNNLSFYQQYKFNDFHQIFDFYIPSANILIDVSDNKIKENYCEENYINLIRIKYDQIDDLYRILWDNLKIYIKS